MLFMINNALPSTLLTKLISIFQMAGVNVGEKYHYRQFLNTFRGVADRVRRAAVRKSFSRRPVAQQHMDFLHCQG